MGPRRVQLAPHTSGGVKSPNLRQDPSCTQIFEKTRGRTRRLFGDWLWYLAHGARQSNDGIGPIGNGGTIGTLGGGVKISEALVA